MRNLDKFAEHMRAAKKDESGIERKKGDFKTEIHFVGEIVAGSLFPEDEELFCEASLEISEDWFLLHQHSSKYSLQTQCCSGVNEEGFFVWSHPFDLHLGTNSLSGWPKFLLRVWRLDLYGNIDIVGYGSCCLPNKPGATDVVCETWRPRGTPMQESQAFFLEAPPKLSGADVLSTTSLAVINSQSSGRVHIHFEAIMKNFRALGIN